MRTLIICLAILVCIALIADTARASDAAHTNTRTDLPFTFLAVADDDSGNRTQNDNGTSAFRQEAEEAEKAAKDALDAARRYADKLGESLRKKLDEWGEKAGEALADDLDALQKELNELKQRLNELEKEYEQEQEREQPAEREGLTTI
ncbi:hypothetical protein DPQ33_07590 [Oceanidesulfovibrio indonesiensis]|uniref:Uncharacterized protein n=1 Tax=Oceanidesulfovibrio indonesiensis TaxID=54767 RepID=A0A7M3MFS8_9BACT|nr:hypothetical protein [Oceanidesulfovibrio indonesiensis]TVM17964.1 hypothetical protein DPQ33_07590 [Oceanidesulfovibrio indonesiensis]